MGVKSRSQESPIMFMIRKFYYNLLSRLAAVELTANFNGFGLYDRGGDRHLAIARRCPSLSAAA